MSEKEGEPSIDDIIAGQQAHEAEIQRQKNAAAAEAARQQELHDRAGADYGTRVDLSGERESIQSEIEADQAQQIEERLAEADRLKEDQTQKELELAQSEEEFVTLEDRLRRLQSLAEGKSDEEIAPQTVAAIERTQTAYDALNAQRGTLVQEIEGIRTRQLSDSEVQRYQSLLERSQQINDQIGELETNPALVEILTNEAETKQQLLDQVVYEAMSQLRTGNIPEGKREIVQGTVTRFMEEEFAARGISQVKDPADKLSQMRELVQDIIIGYGIDRQNPSSTQRLSGFSPRRIDQANTGIVLHSLTGGYGDVSTTLDLLREFGQGDLRGSLSRHFGSINYLRACTQGMPNSRDVVPQTYDWERFDTEIQRIGAGVKAPRSGPLVLREATPTEESRANVQFDKVKQEASKLEAEIIKRKMEAKEGRLRALDAQIELLTLTLAEVQRAETLWEQDGRNLESYRSQLAQLESDQARQEQIKKNTEDELAETTGFFQGGTRRELRRSINDTEAEIETITTRINSLKKKIEPLARAEQLLSTVRSENNIPERKNLGYISTGDLSRAVQDQINQLRAEKSTL